MSTKSLFISSGQLIVKDFSNEVGGKRREVNRFSLATANGLLKMSVPLVGGRSSKTSNECLQVNYTEPWPRDFLRTIESAYRKAPFFEWYFHEIKSVLENRFDTLKSLVDASNLKLFQLASQSANLTVRMLDESGWEHVVYSSNAKNETHPSYPQVFSDRHGFLAGLSYLDALFNLGPSMFSYLPKATESPDGASDGMKDLIT